ncbi:MULTISPECIES: endonuclease [unclassified Marinovum]
MTDRSTGPCARKCWTAAAIVGALVFLMLVFSYGLLAALVVGLLAFGLLGSLLVWLGCSPTPKSGVVSTTATPSAQTILAQTASTPAKPAPAPEPKPEPTPEPAAAPTEASPTPDAGDVEAPVADKAAMTPSAALAGEDELSERKGSWTYETEVEETPAPVSPLKPSAALPGQDELASRKGSWTYSGTAPDASAKASGTGAKPAALSAARASGADDLKQIKGVGPKMEQMLNGMGFYHFDQIAAWTDSEVSWVDDNLEGFKGRVSRDAWVAQAKTLAAVSDTDLSARASDGNVN